MNKSKNPVFVESRDFNFQVQSINSEVRANNKKTDLAEISDSPNPQLLGAHRCRNTAISVLVKNVFPVFGAQEIILEGARVIPCETDTWIWSLP